MVVRSEWKRTVRVNTRGKVEDICVRI